MVVPPLPHSVSRSLQMFASISCGYSKERIFFPASLNTTLWESRFNYQPTMCLPPRSLSLENVWTSLVVNTRLKCAVLGKAPTLDCLISAPMKAVLSEYTFLLKACIDVWCQHYVDFETIDYQIIIKKIVLSGKVFQATFMVRYEVPYNIATDAYTKITDKNP